MGALSKLPGFKQHRLKPVCSSLPRVCVSSARACGRILRATGAGRTRERLLPPTPYIADIPCASEAWQVTPGQPGLALYGNRTDSLQFPTGTERSDGAGWVPLRVPFSLRPSRSVEGSEGCILNWPEASIFNQ